MLDFSDLSFICRKTQVEEIPERTLQEMGFFIDVPVVRNPAFDPVLFHLDEKLSETPYVRIGSIGCLYLRFLMQHLDVVLAFQMTQQLLNQYHVTSEELQHELERCGIYSLTAENAEKLCEIFQYLIETLLPRQLGDLYVDFALRPHPAYSVFFSLAAERLGIEVCHDHNDSRCGQLLGSTTSGAVRHILAGQSLQFIYENTCATKRHIHSAVSMLFYYSKEALEDAQISLDLLQIEDALFSLARCYRYERRYVSEALGSSFDFAVFEENRLVLLVDYLGEDIMDDDRLLSYNAAIERSREKQEKCHQAGLPLLQFDTWELSYEDYYISSIIRRVLKNPEYAQTHSRIRRQQLAEEDELWEDEHP